MTDQGDIPDSKESQSSSSSKGDPQKTVSWLKSRKLTTIIAVLLVPIATLAGILFALKVGSW